MASDPELHLESSKNLRGENVRTNQQTAEIISQFVTIRDGATGGRHTETVPPC